MGTVSHPGYTQNRGRLASGRLPVVLDLGFKAWTSGGTKTGEQASSCSDLSHGYRESNLGSAAYSRRVAQTGLPSVGSHCLAMASANSENSRSRETLADVPPEPSRGNCSHGLLHRTDAHVWRPVLFLCHRPRPAEDPAFQRDPKSECSLDRAAATGGMAVRAGAQIPFVRSRLKVRNGCTPRRKALTRSGRFDEPHAIVDGLGNIVRCSIPFWLGIGLTRSCPAGP